MKLPIDSFLSCSSLQYLLGPAHLCDDRIDFKQRDTLLSVWWVMAQSIYHLNPVPNGHCEEGHVETLTALIPSRRLLLLVLFTLVMEVNIVFCPKQGQEYRLPKVDE